jgi:glycosyltransferase involved in cell wall biosynthesis
MRFAGASYLRDAAAVVFATRREMEKARHIYDGPNARVVHWPVSLLDLSQRGSARTYVRDLLELPPEARVLLYLGRYDGMKRPLETIEAFAKANTPNLYLVMVGNDSGLEIGDLKKQVSDYNMEKQVHVVGPKYGEEKNKMLLGADGFISLSHRENFGYTTGEALSASIPVILSPGNDLSFELKNEDCGWCLSSVEFEEASAAIGAFAQESESDLQERGRRGRQWCEAHLRMETFRESLLDVYSGT